MRSFILLALFASIAVTALAQEALPGHEVEALPEVSSAADAPESTFTEEGEFASAEAFSQAQDLVEKKGSTACADLADATIKEVKANIKQEQDILNKIDNGAKCPKEGQPAVDTAKADLKKAEKAKKDADKALADAKNAKVNFGDFTFSALTPGNCQAFFGSNAYTSAKAKVESADKAASTAVGLVSGAKTAVSAAEAAAKKAVKKCQCDAYKAHQNALEAANKKTEASQKAAWTKGYHLKCVLAGTPLSSCSVPSMPTVKAVSLAPGVGKEACGPAPLLPKGANKASFPLSNPKGKFEQTPTKHAYAVKVSGTAETGFSVAPTDKTQNNWHRGWAGPWKLNKSDLPFRLKWHYDTNGATFGKGNKWQAFSWVGFDYLPDDTHKIHYDCTLNFAIMAGNMNSPYIHTADAGCQSTVANNNCKLGTSQDLEIRFAKDGTGTTWMNGSKCGTFKKKATQFPMYVDMALYGPKTTITKLQMFKD